MKQSKVNGSPQNQRRRLRLVNNILISLFFVVNDGKCVKKIEYFTMFKKIVYRNKVANQINHFTAYHSLCCQAGRNVVNKCVFDALMQLYRPNGDGWCAFFVWTSKQASEWFANADPTESDTVFATNHGMDHLLIILTEILFQVLSLFWVFRFEDWWLRGYKTIESWMLGREHSPNISLRIKSLLRCLVWLKLSKSCSRLFSSLCWRKLIELKGF